eukprot:gene8431-10350_t
MAKSYLVVGGCGFLGRFIVEALLKRGETNVQVFDVVIREFDNRVQYHKGDITKREDLDKAVKGIDCVIHTASPPHGRGYDVYYAVNVRGTELLVEACKANGVKQLVYTSSSSVVFNGDDIVNGDETLPYVKKHLDPYNKTKELGEKAVLAAHDPSNPKGLQVVALRPAGIFGPRDVQGWPKYLEAAKEGKNKYMFGSGENICDWTYIDNVVHSHLLAADKMVPGSPISGQAYFITNDEPIKFWDMPIFAYESFGYSKPSIKIPFAVIYVIAWLIDMIVSLLSPVVTLHPTITLFRMVYSNSTRYFNISKAKRDLGYKPVVSVKDVLCIYGLNAKEAKEAKEACTGPDVTIEPTTFTSTGAGVPQCATMKCMAGYQCIDDPVSGGHCVPGLSCANILCNVGTKCVESINGPSCIPDNSGVRTTCANVRCPGSCMESPTGPVCLSGCSVVFCAPGSTCVDTPSGPKCMNGCMKVRCSAGHHCEEQATGPVCVPTIDPLPLFFLQEILEDIVN